MGLTVDRVLRARWRAVGLPTRRPGRSAARASEEVRRLGAVQAQEFETTLWSLGRRTGESRACVLAQFTGGEFVRTHALRQTWHFVHRDDLTLVQAATAVRVHQRNAPLYRREGLDERALRICGEVVAEAVADGPVTRARVGELLASRGLSLSGFGVGVAMMWAELECLVVSGPLAGRQHTYVASSVRRLPDRADAIVSLGRRFFSSHGPATLDDFVSWSSLTRGEAAEAVRQLPLQRAQVEGAACLWLGELDDDPWDSPQAELLNAYDEYVSGSSPSGKRWLDRGGLWRDRAGTPVAVVMVDGQLAGHWRRSATTSRVSIDVWPLRPFRPAERAALERNAARYGGFVGLEPQVVVRPFE